MDEEEIIEELVCYLNAGGQWEHFLSWSEQRGFDSEQLETDIVNILDNE